MKNTGEKCGKRCLGQEIKVNIPVMNCGYHVPPPTASVVFLLKNP